MLSSGIARVVSFEQAVKFTTHNPEVYFKDTLCESSSRGKRLCVPHHIASNAALDYTAGPLFWIFAENAIAIIGACLPTLAPLWTRKPELASKRWTWFKRSWKGSKSDHYDNLESQYQNNTSGDNTSIYPLVAQGPATNILADNIALEDRPQQGIQVRTTLSSNYRQQETSSTT